MNWHDFGEVLDRFVLSVTYLAMFLTLVLIGAIAAQ